jgi:hypothetical protein
MTVMEEPLQGFSYTTNVKYVITWKPPVMTRGQAQSINYTVGRSLEYYLTQQATLNYINYQISRLITNS